MNTKRLKRIVDDQMCMYHKEFGILLIRSRDGVSFNADLTTLPVAFSDLKQGFKIKNRAHRIWLLPDEWWEDGWFSEEGGLNRLTHTLDKDIKLCGNLHQTLNLLTTAAFL